MNIVLASENFNKLKEIESLLSGLPITLRVQSFFNVPPLEENGLSFLENAILKARHAAKYSSLPSLADDSGLCVEALGGAPGIYSARYAGQTATAKDNMNKLIKAMVSQKHADKNAFFYCVIALVRHEKDPTPLIAQGRWDGQIILNPRGENGFGYDPIFFIPELNCTAAELSPQQKNKLSHRAKALMEFKNQFKFLNPQ